MPAADPAYCMGWPFFGKIEERQLIAATHVEKDMGRGWLVAIRHDSSQPHTQQFCIEFDCPLQLGADQREVIDTAGLERLRGSLNSGQVTFLERLPALVIKAEVRHRPTPSWKILQISSEITSLLRC